jgi:hypothetical protein
MRVESVTLRNDLLDDKVLHTLEVIQLPVPAVEGGQRVVATTGPILLNDDSLLVLLLHEDPGLAEQVDWAEAVQDRHHLESKGGDPYGVFLPHFLNNRVYNEPLWQGKLQHDPQRVAAFRAWTLERAEKLPANVRIKAVQSKQLNVATISRQIQSGNPLVFDTLGVSLISPPEHPSHETLAIEELQAQHPLARIGGVFRRWEYGVGPLDSMKAYFLARGEKADYQLPWSPDGKAQLTDTLDGMKPGMELTDDEVIEFTLVRVVMLGSGEPKKRACILELGPVSASKTLAGVTVAAKTWSGDAAPALVDKATAPPTTTDTAEPMPKPAPFDVQRASAKPYGPDLASVQLGMRIEQADEKARQSITVDKVFEATAGIENPAPWRKLRLYVDAERSNFVKLYYGAPSHPDRVIAIGRRFIRDENSLPFEPTFNTLKKKYGEPSDSRPDARQATWTLGDDIGYSQHARSDWDWKDIDGKAVSNGSWDDAPKWADRLGMRFDPGYAEENGTYTKSKPAIRMAINTKTKPKSNGKLKMDTLDIWLYDMNAAAAYWHAWQQLKADNTQTLDLGL